MHVPEVGLDEVDAECEDRLLCPGGQHVHSLPGPTVTVGLGTLAVQLTFHLNTVKTVQYSTVQYSTVQYSTVQYSAVQYSTVQYSTAAVPPTHSQNSTVQCSTVQYSTVQYS